MSVRAGYDLHSPEYRRISWALFFAGLASFALLYDTQPLLPDLSDHFGVTADEASLSVSAATLGLAGALLVVGPLSERVGRKPLMVAGLIGSSLLGLLSGAVDTWTAHLAIRFALGVCLSGLPAIGVAYLSEELDPRAQAAASGLFIGGNALGGMTGRLVVGFLNEWWGWHDALLGMGVLATAASVAAIALLPASRGFVPSPLRFRLLWSATSAILRDRGLLCLFAIGMSSMGAFVGIFNMVSYRLQIPPYGLAPSQVSLLFLVYLLGSVASTAAGRLAMRYGHRAVAPPAAALMLAGLLVTLASPLAAIVAGMAAFTAGFFALHGVASGWTGARASAGVGATGQASSLYMVFYYLGSAVIGAGCGWAWHGWGWSGCVAYSAGATAVALAAALALRGIAPLADRRGPTAQGTT